MIDDKSKNKKTVNEFIKKYEIKRIVIFDYHFQVNEMIEKDHKFIVNFLFKIINDDVNN